MTEGTRETKETRRLRYFLGAIAPSAACGGAMTEESNVPLRPPPRVPRPLLGTAAGIGKTVETFLCIYAVLYCEKVTLYPHFRDNLRGKVVDNLDNKVGITFTIHSGFPPLK